VNEPATQAGRALLYIHGEAMREPVLAIEAEAVAPWRAFADHRRGCLFPMGLNEPCNCGYLALKGGNQSKTAQEVEPSD